MRQAVVMIALFLLLVGVAVVVYTTDLLEPGSTHISEVEVPRSDEEEQGLLEERIARAKARKEAKEEAAAADPRDPFTREMEKMGQVEFAQAFVEREPICTQEELDAWTAELVPIIEEITGWKFNEPPVVRAATRAMLVDSIEKDILNSPGNNWTGSGSARIVAALHSAVVLGIYGRTTKEAYLAVTNFGPLMDHLGLDATRGKDLARLALAHELTHALQDDLVDLEEKVRLAGISGAEQLALRAAIEGHAMLIEELVAERIGLSELSQSLSDLYDSPPIVADAANVRDIINWLHDELSFCYGHGRDFVAHHLEDGGHSKLSWVLYSPPRDPGMILNPPAYDDQPRLLPSVSMSMRLRDAIVARGYTRAPSGDESAFRSVMDSYPPAAQGWIGTACDAGSHITFRGDQAGFVFATVLSFRNQEDPRTWQTMAMKVPHQTQAFFATRDDGEIHELVVEAIDSLEAYNGQRIRYVQELTGRGFMLFDTSYSVYERVGIYVIVQARFATPEFHRRVHEDIQREYRRRVNREEVEVPDESIDLTDELPDPPESWKQRSSGDS